jgi:tRNA uridine 5-carbamoylmethylation protein Kti12
LHVGTPPDRCRENNQKLLVDKETDGGYDEEDFENLIFRYEEPNGMTRWDSPLFIVVEEDDTPPCEQMWEALVGTDGKMKVVKANLATVLVRMPIMRWLLFLTSPRNQQRSKTTSTNSTRPRPTSSRKSLHTRKTTRGKEAAR